MELEGLSPANDAQLGLRLVGLYHAVILRTGMGLLMDGHRGSSLALGLDREFLYSFQNPEFQLPYTSKLLQFLQNQGFERQRLVYVGFDINETSNLTFCGGHTSR